MYTHFIEVYKSDIDKEPTLGPCIPMKHLEGQLDFTNTLFTIKTLFVWKIRLKNEGEARHQTQRNG